MSDLISRQDALKLFCVAPDGIRIPEVDCDNFPVEFSVEFIKKHLLSLSSAESKTGEWVEVEKNEYEEFSIVNMRCNQCGRYAYLVLPKGTKCVYDYCPNCGAMMKGGEDE